MAGKFFGHNHATCTLPSNMDGCIFLPAVGQRTPSAGQLNAQGSYGYYWSSLSYNDNNGHALNFSSGSSNGSGDGYKELAFSLRCVQQ